MVDSSGAMRVLLVEDEKDLGLAIKQVLVGEKYVVDWVTDGAQAWYCLETQWADYTVAIFDWLLPELSGLELCRRLRASQNPLPVLMLTALGQPENRIAGLDAGANDYLVKPFVMEELLARLRALQRRSPQLKPQQLTVGAFILDAANTQLLIELPDQPTQEIPLTLKEFQVLAYLMENCDGPPGRSKTIASFLAASCAPSCGTWMKSPLVTWWPPKTAPPPSPSKTPALVFPSKSKAAFLSAFIGWIEIAPARLGERG